jgi:Zn finger protein HypA/HybF involved in hydrogenase expression
MKLKLKVKKYGTGHIVFIPKIVIATFLIKHGDEIIVDIEKVEKDFSIPRTYKCKICQHTFSSDDEKPYCPACDNTALEVLEE